MRSGRVLTTARTKITPPRPRPEVLARARLCQALDDDFDSSDRRAVMLSAPAGFGKTTLLAEWARLHHDTRTTAWATLDSDDQEPLVFWNTVIDALCLALDADEIDLGTLRPDMDPRRHSEFLAHLVDELSKLPRSIAFVFDDAQVIRGSESDAEFVRLLRLAPGQVTTVFATRDTFAGEHDRVSGRLLRLTGDALSFTAAETYAFLSIQEGMTDREIAHLHETTGGWPMALALGSLAVQRPGRDEVDGDLQRTVDPDEMRGYLEREVFHDLSPSEQEVLITTGINPLTTPALIDAVLGTSNARLLVTDLVSKNAMLRYVSTDSQGRHWYRIHPVFGAFAEDRFTQLSEEARRRFVEESVRWHLREGDPLRGVTLALEWGGAELSREALVEAGCQLVLDGFSQELLAMIRRSSVHDPLVDTFMAYAAADLGQRDQAANILASVRMDSLSVDELLYWDWLRYLVDLTLARTTDHVVDALDPGWEFSTLGQLPSGLREGVLVAKGLIDARSGVKTRALPVLVHERAAAEARRRTAAQAVCEVGLAGLAIANADVRSALTTAEAAIEHGRDLRGAQSKQWSAVAHSLVSWCRLQMLDGPAARQYSAEASRLAAGQELDNVREQARRAYNVAHFDALPDKRRVAQETAQSWPWSCLAGAPVSSLVTSLHTSLSMASAVRELRWSERLLDNARSLIGEGIDWQVAYALHLHRAGRHESACKVLAPLINDETSSRTASSTIIQWALSAVLEDEAKNAYRAHAALSRALERADDAGSYWDVTLAGSGAIGRITAKGRGRFGEQEEVAHLLSKWTATTKEGSLPEPLTPKEHELLSELRTLRTVDEIAHDMLLSVNTVKTHMRGIYRKLSVSSRRDAIATAERIGLL